MSPGPWEDLILEWVFSLKAKYARVEKHAGSGDMGLDVIAFESPNAENPWDNYQCKHYDHPLAPHDIWIELGKLAYYTFAGDYSVPRRYQFVAPQGAEINFRDGLNVVAGASDTGKSFICDLIDFAFGASKPPRKIDAARGYERVIVKLQDRVAGASFEIERALSGGDALIRSFGGNGDPLEERTAAAKHSADDDSTLSAFLLKLSGFDSVKVRKNKKGEMRTLSFRDLAFLCVVDETRIIAESPPHLSGSVIETTVEGEVFRLLVTGQTGPVPIVAPKKNTTQTSKARIELLSQLREQVYAEIVALGFEQGEVREEVARIDAVRAVLLQSYETARVELVSLERQRADHGRDLRDVESRIIVLEGLLARFKLLDGHYDSDISRLVSIEETGMFLDSMLATSCPVCGATPASHRPDEAAEHFGLSHVREAATKELEKTKTLRGDLQNVLTGLRTEMVEKEAARAQLQTEISAIQVRIEGELQPQARTSLEKIREQDARRDTLLRARSLVDRLEDLDKRCAEAETAPKNSKAFKSGELTEATTSEMEPFAVCVQEILSAWHYPEHGRVVFSEDKQDIVIGGQERVSHGKGVRALTCAAFITGILRYCRREELPHPGFVVLDSPLVAYKDPDSSGSESARLRYAGVKDAFFRTLADGFCPGQVIVLENEDPPSDVSIRIEHYHFSKSDTGRYGLFPNRS